MKLRHRVLQLLASSNGPHFWCRRLVTVVLVLFIVHLLPKPEFICGGRSQRGWAKDVVQDTLKAKQTRLGSPLAKYTMFNNVVNSDSSRILNMFPIYQTAMQGGYGHSAEQDSGVTEKYNSSVNVFHLKNFNFRNFSQKWVNVNQNKSLSALWNRIEAAVKAEKDRRTFYDKLQRQQLLLQGHLHQLPQCVTLRSLPPEARRTKICVHPSHVDNFISNRLRDFGTWEESYTSQMVQYFQANPQSQLVDIGCNIGVFTLHAASLGVPALAVDILPANLALIQVSIAVNDGLLDNLAEDAFVNPDHPGEGSQDSNNTRKDWTGSALTKSSRKEQQDRMLLVDRQDKYIKDNLQTLFRRSKFRKVRKEKHRRKRSITMDKTQRLYSELITTLHNAVFSKHTLLSIHFKNDLNLGGTDIKEISGKKWANPNLKSNKLSSLERIRAQQNEAKQFIVDAICLDDLIPFLNSNSSVFLKMDIEGSEPDALLCAGDFFMKVDVRVVMLEFFFHKRTPHGKAIVEFFSKKNMLPASDVFGKNLLTSEDPLYWPENVFWIKAR